MLCHQAKLRERSEGEGGSQGGPPRISKDRRSGRASERTPMEGEGNDRDGGMGKGYSHALMTEGRKHFPSSGAVRPTLFLQQCTSSDVIYPLPLPRSSFLQSHFGIGIFGEQKMKRGNPSPLLRGVDAIWPSSLSPLGGSSLEERRETRDLYFGSPGLVHNCVWL